MAELRKCRCGVEPRTIQTSTGWHYVKCPTCGTATEKHVSEMRAAEAWDELMGEKNSA